MTDPTTVYDCIVIGFGGVGSAALREAAKKGWRVLGIDQFGPAHDRGSSHGQTRIIRRAYFEHPDYVPLTHRAFEMWDELNKRHRTSPQIKELITKTGLLQIGRSDSEIIEGVRKSAKLHDLKVEQFTSEEIERRLPLFKIDQGQVGLFEPDAALLRVELCVAAMIDQAVKHGAEICSNVTVSRWSVKDNGDVRVSTQDGNFVAKRLIISAGAWTPELLPNLDLGLSILQKQQHWFPLDRVDQKIENNFPCFLLEQDNGSCFYGFPEIDYLGMKVCEHTGGIPIAGPQSIDRELDEAELERTNAFMKSHFNFGRSRLVHHSTCMYTMSADGHFYVDNYPALDNIVFAAGLSGHGFKFAPVLGRHLIQLLDGQCDPEFEFLRVGNRALNVNN